MSVIRPGVLGFGAVPDHENASLNSQVAQPESPARRSRTPRPPTAGRGRRRRVVDGSSGIDRVMRVSVDSISYFVRAQRNEVRTREGKRESSGELGMVRNRALIKQL